jgi:hypothetical protein
MNSTGLNLARSGPHQGKTRSRAPALVILRRGPQRFKKPVKNPDSLFPCVSHMCIKGPLFFLLHTTGSPTMDDGVGAKANFYRQPYSIIHALIRSMPNSNLGASLGITNLVRTSF